MLSVIHVLTSVFVELRDFAPAGSQMSRKLLVRLQDFPTSAASHQGSSAGRQCLAQEDICNLHGVTQMSQFSGGEFFEIVRLVLLRGFLVVTGRPVNFQNTVLRRQLGGNISELWPAEICSQRPGVLDQVQQVVSCVVLLANVSPTSVVPLQSLSTKVNHQSKLFQQRTWKEEWSTSFQDVDIQMTCLPGKFHWDDCRCRAVNRVVVADRKILSQSYWRRLQPMPNILKYSAYFSRVFLPTTND